VRIQSIDSFGHSTAKIANNDEIDAAKACIDRHILFSATL